MADFTSADFASADLTSADFTSTASQMTIGSGDAYFQGSLGQPSEFQTICCWGSESDYYSRASDTVPQINFDGGECHPHMAFSEPSIKNEAGFEGISSDERLWPSYTSVPCTTELEQGILFTSDPSQTHEAPCASLDSVLAPQMTTQNYNTPNSDTVANYSPTSDDFSITLTQDGFLALPPLFPTSPVRRKRESSSVSSTSTVSGGGRITKPKQRLIKHHPNGGKAPTTRYEQALRGLIDASGTGVYHGHITSAEAAAADHAELARMFRRAPKLCTSPQNDATFPAHDAGSREYVREMFDAIWDWSDYVEMHKTIGLANMSSSQEPSNVPLRAEQQKKVLGSPLNDYVVEHLCWCLLKFAQDAQQGIPTVEYWSGADGAWESYATFRDRVAAIGDSLRSSKQLVKSVLAGDRWCARIANNPKGEYTHKVNNMKVNRRKNERLREATSARKKKEEDEEEEE